MPLSDATQQLQDNPTITRAIPGASLTANPGQFPYERPPATARPDQAFLVLKRELYRNGKDIIELVSSGLSCETIVSSLVMNAFTQGMCSPDVAEIIKEPLMIEVFKIADNFNLTNVRLENVKPSKSVSSEHTYSFKQDMGNPVGIEDTLPHIEDTSENTELPTGFMDKPAEPELTQQEEIV
tara:strand:+ start:531 stop:1076 length:546 start_codon:yes stop_codon:yes gene_type:complete